MADEEERSSLLRGVRVLTGRNVASAARSGDVLARRAMALSARCVGIAIGNVLNVLNLDRVIIGGGLAASGPDYLARVRCSVAGTVAEGVRVDVVLAELGGEAPLWGACVLTEETCS